MAPEKLRAILKATPFTHILLFVIAVLLAMIWHEQRVANDSLQESEYLLGRIHSDTSDISNNTDRR